MAASSCFDSPTAKFVPTFYVEPCHAGYRVFVADSDRNGQNRSLATGHDKVTAIKNARRRYFGNPRRSDEVNVVWV